MGDLNMATKVTVNLPDRTVAALRDVAERRGASVTETLRNMVEAQRFLDHEVARGQDVLLYSQRDGRARQVIFNHC
jgi:hypothetical protein